MGTTEEQPNDDKFRELILFISERSEGDPPFGATKLNKLLFFVDFMAYRRFGRSITGQIYQKLENGPAPRRFLPTIHQMEAAGDARRVKRHYHGKQQIRTLALREPELSGFTADEIALVTGILNQFWGKSATEMSSISHEFIGWKLAAPQEDIPYTSMLVSNRPLTAKEEAHARSLEQLARECLGRDA